MTWYEVSSSSDSPVGTNIAYRTRSHNKLLQWLEKQVRDGVYRIHTDPLANMETFIHAYRWRISHVDRVAIVLAYDNTLYLYRFEDSVGAYQDKGYFWMKFQDDTVEGQIALANSTSQFNFAKNSMAQFPFEKVTTLMQQVNF